VRLDRLFTKIQNSDFLLARLKSRLFTKSGHLISISICVIVRPHESDLRSAYPMSSAARPGRSPPSSNYIPQRLRGQQLRSCHRYFHLYETRRAGAGVLSERGPFIISGDLPIPSENEWQQQLHLSLGHLRMSI